MGVGQKKGHQKNLGEIEWKKLSWRQKVWNLNTFLSKPYIQK